MNKGAVRPLFLCESMNMEQLQHAEALRLAMIAQRDREAMLGRHKRRCELERQLKYQTLEVLRLYLKKEAGA